MGLGRYLRDHVASLVLLAGAIALIWVVLTGVRVVSGVRELVTSIILLFSAIAVAIDYGRQARFWHGLADVAEMGAEESWSTGAEVTSLDAVDLIEDPPFSTGHIALSALDAVSAEARGEVAQAEAASEEHRSYIETWVHEVKTPIAAAHLIVDNHPNPESASIAGELDRIDAYVEQALYVARSTSLERDYAIRSCDLATLVGDAVKSRARSLIETGTHVSMDGLDQPVLADAKWVGFILGQLIDNAVKYRARPVDGREPTLSLAAERLAAGTAEERVVLSVSDNGCGIQAADLDRVFDKGFVGENGRRADQGKATGIGLWLVRRLCDKMGVGLGIESVAGEGTTVRLTFPANRMHYLADE